MGEEAEVTVSIVGFVAEGQPNFVEFVLHDALGEKWLFHDKVPIVSELYLDERSSYPVPAVVRCTIVGRYIDGAGRPLAVIDTGQLDHVEELAGEKVFTVRADQLSLPKYHAKSCDDLRLKAYALTDLEGAQAELWFQSQRVAARIGFAAAKRWAYVVLPDLAIIAIGLKHLGEPSGGAIYKDRMFVAFENTVAVFSYPDLTPEFSSEIFPRFNEFLHIDDHQIIIANELGFAGISMDGAVSWNRLFDDWIVTYKMAGDKIVGEFSDGGKFEFDIPTEF
ncbi:hypothetical protein IHQ71_27965 [Rhizobium sp. TH2]|uniref:hypothetical protein n=1 Tax=Rhizobium sp. TH2 TaxID=2775403 RepID=UPI0021587C71|nr:hypothetical protein [Rhizobium sp. TH2]UVC08905.1 hypothetical protein IHQ71_27965 [Rhizobium sp. TH2]